jgi:hypothetical protein
VTALSSPTTQRRWTPVLLVVAAALGLGGIAGAASLADGDEYGAGPGGRLSVQQPAQR